MTTTRRIATETLAAVLALSLVLLPGCGPHVGKQTVVIKYYANCYEPLLDLRATAEKVKADAAKGALFGALTGAVAGLMARGDLKGALVGALIGAAVGAVGTYIVSASLQEKALSERLSYYEEAMTGATTELNNASRAARATCDCYAAEYKKLKRSYGRNKNPTPEQRAEMLERVQEMRDGNNDAVEVLTYYGTLAAENLTSFDAVVAHEESRETDRAGRNEIRRVRNNRAAYRKASESVQSNLTLAQKQAALYDDEFNALTQQAERSDPRRIMAGRPAEAPGL